MPKAPNRISVRGRRVFNRAGREWQPRVPLDCRGAAGTVEVVVGDSSPKLVWRSPSNEQTGELQLSDGTWTVGASPRESGSANEHDSEPSAGVKHGCQALPLGPGRTISFRKPGS